MKKKMLKKLLLMLVMVVLCLAVGMTASALETTGQCGDNVYWSYNETTGELVISGEGEMYDYEYSRAPFFRSEIKSVKIGNGITTIGAYSFYDCKYLTNIDWSNSIRSIGRNSFYGCEKLTSIKIPDGVMNIGENAFHYCKNLISVELPDSIKNIGGYAFYHCYKLSDITIGANVESIGNDAFTECNSLKRIIVDENNAFYTSDESGVLFNKDKSALIFYPTNSNNDSYVIPNSVTTICDGAFTYCYNLTEISIPDSVTEIGDYNFVGCFNITNIELPSSIKYIGNGSFSANFYLENITIKSNGAVIEPYSVCFSMLKVSEEISREEFTDLVVQYLIDDNEEIWDEISNYMTYLDEPIMIGTIYAHSGSTAEKYATDLNAPFVSTHFYEGEWTYDYDNMVRTRKCIHCDELETEKLESAEDDDVEIIDPVEPDTPSTPEVETKVNFLSKIFDIINDIIDLLLGWMKR